MAGAPTAVEATDPIAQSVPVVLSVPAVPGVPIAQSVPVVLSVPAVPGVPIAQSVPVVLSVPAVPTSAVVTTGRKSASGPGGPSL
jgi:hypothetical protein